MTFTYKKILTLHVNWHQIIILFNLLPSHSDDRYLSRFKLEAHETLYNQMDVMITKVTFYHLLSYVGDTIIQVSSAFIIQDPKVDSS